MKIISNDVMTADNNLVVYLSDGEAARQLKEEHPTIYNWVFPRTPLPLGGFVKTGVTPWMGHVVMYAVDEYGGIKASDLHECFSEFKKYVKENNIDENEIGITKELAEIIINKDYIKE